MATSGCMLTLVTLVSAVVQVNAISQCLKFRWVGEDNSPLQGIRIAGTETYDEQIGYMNNKTSADDCFYDCCVKAVESSGCNAASFYTDDSGVNHCFLLFCDPFSDCQWTLSYDREHKSAFMSVVSDSSSVDVKVLANDIEENLEWNIVQEDTTSAPATTAAATTDDSQVIATNVPASSHPHSTTQAATTQAPTTQAPTTQAPTTQAPTTQTEQQHETVGVTTTQGSINWPSVTGSADEGMGDSSDNGDDVGTADDKDLAGGADQPSGEVNETAIIVCSLGGVALLIAGIVIAIKRYQVEKDRSVYRPLMDEIQSRGFKESDPLH
ncbi:hypothetical protein CAPTEDRAFT_221607 [Capitella teleta]|uniref:MANSC domain-containing protein n=1 Tax=Capitella teleta TaxID=283909 RepID=R7UY13_CAPTE|nr:hypothetical protein CAPTEDRAFT_221607 [Capitella teleta]|eukprot:ELU11473.1 hypothetical protein CAPTEDRAFT_221607 [Capitella teleta]